MAKNDVQAFNETTKQLLLKQKNLEEKQTSLKDTIQEVKSKNNTLLLKATGDNTEISFLKQYIRSLESKNKILEKENAKLSEQNRNLKMRERSTQKLENSVERLSKDKARLLALMRQSSEFKLLGHLANQDSEVTFLHSLGFFSDYDVDKIQLTNKNKLFPDDAIKKFNKTMLVKAQLSSPVRTAKHKTDSNWFDPAIKVEKSIHGFGSFGNHLKVKCSAKKKLFSEEQLWVDRGIFDYAMDMREKLNEQFSEELMEHLLFKLNSHFVAKLNTFKKSLISSGKTSKGPPSKAITRNFSSSQRNMNFIKTLNNYCRK